LVFRRSASSMSRPRSFPALAIRGSSPAEQQSGVRRSLTSRSINLSQMRLGHHRNQLANCRCVNTTFDLSSRYFNGLVDFNCAHKVHKVVGRVNGWT
jgi:hypothetical protein